jgi:hypothetical protein
MGGLAGVSAGFRVLQWRVLSWRQAALGNNPHWRKNDAVHDVERHFDAPVEGPRKRDSVVTLSIGDVGAERAVRRPGSGPLVGPTMNRVDRGADGIVQPCKGLVGRRFRPEDERPTNEPANSAKLYRQLRFAQSAHRGFILKGRDLIPQPLDLACGLIVGSNVERYRHFGKPVPLFRITR